MAEVGEHVIYVYHDEDGLTEKQATIIAVVTDDRCSLSVASLGRVNNASLCQYGTGCHGRYYYEE